jgi:hypothetical protein
MPIDTRFLTRAKDRATAIKRSGVAFAKGHPRSATAAAAAMLLAPALLQNENRDYSQTAAFTTPLIGAVAYSASTMGPTVSQNMTRMVGMPKAHRQWRQSVHGKEVSYTDIKEAQRAYEQQKIALEQFQTVKRRRYAGMTRSKGDYNRVATTLETIVDADLKTSKNMRYISNAIHAEKLRSLDAAGLAEYAESLNDGMKGPGAKVIPRNAPMLTEKDIKLIMKGKVKAFREGTASSGDVKFIKGLTSRMADKKNFFDPGGARAAGAGPKTFISSVGWNDAEGLRAELATSRPDLFGSIERAIRSGGAKGQRFNPKYLSIQTSEEDGNAIVGLTYKPAGQRKGLTIPVVGKDGEIRTGSSFQRRGVARNVYTARDAWKSDAYAFEALGRGFGIKTVGEELKRTNMYGMVDQSDSWSAYRDTTYGEYVQRNGAQKLRQYEYLPSDLFGFGNAESGPGKGLRQLRKGKTGAADFVEAGVSAAEYHNLIPLGSEGGVPEFKLYAHHVGDLSRNASLEKQNSVYRAITKNIRIAMPAETFKGVSPVRDSLSPFASTGKIAAEGIVDPVMGVRVAGITPGEQTLFGDMPDVTSYAEGQIEQELSRVGRVTSAETKAIRLSAYLEAFAANGRYDLTAMSIMQAEHKLDHAGAKDAWFKVVQHLSEPGNFRAMKSAGRAGEGDFLSARNLNGARVERYMAYDVNEEAVSGWENFMGQSMEKHYGLLDEDGKRTFTLSAEGKKVYGPSKILLGRRNGNPVTAQGAENFIENTHNMGDGTTRFVVREVKDIETGTKFNVGSQKGILQSFDRTGDSERLRTGLNNYRDATGAGGFIPREVDVYASQGSFTNKDSELQDALSRISSDSLRRLEEHGELEPVMSKWRDPLAEAGFAYNNGTLNQDLTKQGIRTPERIQQEDTVLKNMLQDVSDRITSHAVRGDEFMQSYAAHVEKGGKTPWADYVNRYAMPSELRITDDMAYNVPKQTKFAYYTQQQLVIRGHHGVAGNITGRLKYDGDLTQTRDLLKHFQGDETAISNTISLGDAIAPGTRSITTASNRAGSIFDPGNVAAENNFMLKMPDGSAVPVLGHSAYGGKVNRYGAGQFSTNEHESALFQLMKMHEEGADEGTIARQTEAYKDTLKKFVHGKDSFYRSGPVDPLSQTLASHTRPSSMRYADGAINPWEVAIGKAQARKIRSKKVRDALLNGEDVFAMLSREPVGHVPLVRVVLDPHLNKATGIGIDERIRALMMLDMDGDRPNISYLDSEDAIAEAREAVMNPKSSQNLDVPDLQNLVGVGDETRQTVGTKEGAYKSFLGRLKDQKFYTRNEALRRRSVGGAVGSGSNTYSMMMAALEENRNITNSQVKSSLSTFFMQAVKQGPISGMKLKNQNDLDLAKALEIDSSLRNSMRKGGTFDHFYGSLGQLADAADGNDRTSFRDYLAENREILEQFHSGFDREAVDQAVQAMTTPAENAASAKTLGMGSEMFSYSQAASTTAEEARTAAGAASTWSAEALGTLNEVTRTAESVAREARGSKIGMVLGIGAAAAVIAGIATTRLSKPFAAFGRDSTSKYRPEETHPGPDMVPGDGPAGSRAPSRPPRNVNSAPAQTRTTTVAPLGETRDLDVRLRSSDQQRAHHTAKMMARMATDGSSTVTINYRDQMKPGSLRTREKMQQALEG